MGKMLRLSLLTSLSVCRHVQSIALPQPEPTLIEYDVANLINGWTPKPTQKPLPRWLGAVDEKHLFARQSSYVPQTCGWTSASAAYPATCGSGYACAYYTGTDPQNFGCCVTSFGTIDWGQCAYYSTCVDYGQSNNAYSGSVVIIAAPTVYCPSAWPYCTTNFLSGNDGSTYLNWGCGSASTFNQLYQYTQSSVAPDTTTNIVSYPVVVSNGPDTITQVVTRTPDSDIAYDNPADPNSNGPTIITGGGNAPTGGGNAGEGAPPQISFSPGSSTPTPTDHGGGGGGGSSANTGAIAGGAVGGVAALAALAAGIGYLIWRKKKHRVEPMAEVSTYYNKQY